jgi:hypothetical protein
MPYGTPSLARQPEHGRFNRFLASLPPHDFSLLVPHLHTITLKRGVMLHDVGEEIEHVYFPHTAMVSLVAVMQSGATVETAANVETLHRETLKALRTPNVEVKFAALGLEPMVMPPAEFDAHIKAEIRANAALINAAGIK